MSDSDSVKKSKILVFGDLGEKLRKLDEDRLMCCIQHDPNIALSKIALDKIYTQFEELKAVKDAELKAAKDAKKKDGDAAASKKKIKDAMITEIDVSHKFREFAEFFHEDMDELSRGSAIMGELNTPEAKFARLVKKKDGDE